jgi:endonuclease YncB( thermonuclease family)
MSVRTYPARLRRVIDGDTYLLLIDQGFGNTTTQRVRLRNVDTPEVVGETRADGLAAAEFARSRLASAADGFNFSIVTHKDERSFDRWVADVYLADGKSLADELVNHGYARRVRETP